MLRHKREQLEQQIEIVKVKTIEFICNPFNYEQNTFMKNVLNNPFLDLRYMSDEFVTMNKPFIFAFIESGKKPRVIYEVEEGKTKHVRALDSGNNPIICDIIRSKNELNLRDLVERDKLLYG